MSASALSLAGRTAMVTGAGSGIGRGIALALAAVGANVVVAARRRVTGEETAALIRAEGGRVLVVESDVAERADVDRAFAESAGRFGGVDIVIHNANSSESAHPVALEDITDESWTAQSRVTWDGAFWLARAALPYLKQSTAGRFILLGSAFGLHGAGFNPVYAALKGGFRGFTKALAREWGPFGITVNAIQPAAATEPAEVFFKQFPDIRDQFMRNFPMGRMGRPREDIGRAVVAICADEFGFITAQTIQVDGGLFTAI